MGPRSSKSGRAQSNRLVTRNESRLQPDDAAPASAARRFSVSGAAHGETCAAPDADRSSAYNWTLLSKAASSARRTAARSGAAISAAFGWSSPPSRDAEHQRLQDGLHSREWTALRRKETDRKGVAHRMDCSTTNRSWARDAPTALHSCKSDLLHRRLHHPLFTRRTNRLPPVPRRQVAPVSALKASSAS